MIQELPVNCINILEREDRKTSAEKQAQEQGFYIRFFEGIVDRHNRKKGVNLAHKKVVKQAQENGEKWCCVMEDDCVFFDKGAWDFFLANVDEDADIFLGMCYICDLDQNNRIKGLFSSLTLYVVSHRFYDFFLSLPDDCHIDRELGLTSDKHKYIVCNPFVCEQINNIKSDNSLMACDYRPYLEGRNLYSNDKTKEKKEASRC